LVRIAGIQRALDELWIGCSIAAAPILGGSWLSVRRRRDALSPLLLWMPAYWLGRDLVKLGIQSPWEPQGPDMLKLILGNGYCSPFLKLRLDWILSQSLHPLLQVFCRRSYQLM